MAFAEEGDEHFLHDSVLTDDDPGGLFLDAADVGLDVFPL